MRKMVVGLISTIILVLMLTACGGGENSSDPIRQVGFISENDYKAIASGKKPSVVNTEATMSKYADNAYFYFELSNYNSDSHRVKIEIEANFNDYHDECLVYSHGNKIQSSLLFDCDQKTEQSLYISGKGDIVFYSIPITISSSMKTVYANIWYDNGKDTYGGVSYRGIMSLY